MSTNTVGSGSSNALSLLAWGLWALAMTFIVLKLVLIVMNWSTPVPESWGFRGGQAVLAFFLSTVGLVIALRRPRFPIGWALGAIGVLAGFADFGVDYAIYGTLTRPGTLPLANVVAWLSNWMWAVQSPIGLIGILMVFPDGRLLSRRWRSVAWYVAVAGAVMIVGVALTPGPLAILTSIDNPLSGEDLGIDAPAELWRVVGLLQLPSLIAIVFALALRYRRADEVVRHQLKWLVGAFAVSMVFFPLSTTGLKVFEVLALLAGAGVPLAIGVAVLRYRLYDIDLIINRTLVYGSLTATLAAAYFGSVVVLQAVFRTITDQESGLAVVVSTLVIAALFVPLRGRLQAFIDRRFYRSRYDAEQTIATFSVRARDEVDLEQISSALVGVVEDTMRPAHASLWLRER